MMKKYLLVSALLLCLLPSVSLTGSGKTASVKGKAGIPVEFKIPGNAVKAEFYSGEEFCDYTYAEKDRVLVPGMFLSFSTAYVKGKQYHPLRVKISTDYDGSGTEESVLAAEWADITDLCALPSEIRDTDGAEIPPTLSGRVDISRFFPSDGKPVFIGFFYRVDPFDKSRWNTRTMVSVRDLKVVSDAYGITCDAFAISRQNMTIIKGESYGQDTNVPEFGGKGGKVTVRFLSEQKPDSERLAYAVTSAIKAGNPLVLGPDEPKTVPAGGSDFSYVYEKKGVYDAVFVLYDSSGKRIVNRMNVTIK